MTSLVFIIIGVLFIIIAVKDNLKFVLNEIKSIGTTGSTASTPTPLTPPSCIDAATGAPVPCIAKNSLTQIQQNLVDL